MSAPVTERTRTAARTRTATRPRTDAVPAQRTAPARETTGASTSAKKAYAKREDRLRRLVGGVRPARVSAAPAGRAQFVLLVMVLLAVGLVATLWLSTAAASDSYRLQAARNAAQALSGQSERLHREVAQMGSAPALARSAAALGMVPVQDPARLVVASGGGVTVVGEPKAATVPAPVVPPAANPAAPGTAPAPTAAVTDPNAAPGGGAPVVAQPGAAASQPGATQATAAAKPTAPAKPGTAAKSTVPAKPGASQPTTQSTAAARAAGTGTG